MYAQQTKFAMSHFDVFDSFFKEMLGDMDSYDELDTVSYTLQYFYFLVTSIILTVAMLNMLIAIIGETFGRVKEAEEMTRVYELLNIVTEFDILERKGMMEEIENQEEKEKRASEFLIYIHNEKPAPKKEEDELSELVNQQGEVIRHIENSLEDLKNKVSAQLKIQRINCEENFKKLKKIYLTDQKLMN